MPTQTPFMNRHSFTAKRIVSVLLVTGTLACVLFATSSRAQSTAPTVAPSQEDMRLYDIATAPSADRLRSATAPVPHA